jgi:hypothetical protein
MRKHTWPHVYINPTSFAEKREQLGENSVLA